MPATSRLLQRLARRGLVAFEEDPRDSRATICRLTEEGAALRRAVVSYRRQRLAQIIRTIDLRPGVDELATLLADAFRDQIEQDRPGG